MICLLSAKADNLSPIDPKFDTIPEKCNTKKYSQNPTNPETTDIPTQWAQYSCLDSFTA